MEDKAHDSRMLGQGVRPSTDVPGINISSLPGGIRRITPGKQTGPLPSPSITRGGKRPNLTDESIRVIATPTSTAINTFFYVQRVGYYEATYPFRRDKGGFDAYNIFITLSGTGFLEYRGKHHSINPGDVVWFDCMKPYSIGAEKGNRWDYLWIQFNGNSARGYYKEFTKRGDYIANVGSDVETFRNLLFHILELSQSTSIRREILVNDSLVHIMTLLLETRVDSSLTLNSVPDFVRATVDHLNWSYAEPFSLDKLAEDVGVSKYHLSRGFKQYVGVTIGEYVTANRLRFARELLKYTDKPVHEVAELCGIPHVSHFIAVFKSSEGVTPLAYRKHWEQTGYYEDFEPAP